MPTAYGHWFTNTTYRHAVGIAAKQADAFGARCGAGGLTLAFWSEELRLAATALLDGHGTPDSGLLGVLAAGAV